jgi:hypothetical protein
MLRIRSYMTRPQLSWAVRRQTLLHMFGRTLLILIVATRLAAQSETERKLAWVETTTPARMLADSSRLGRVHFLTICDLYCHEPAMEALTYSHCYARIAGKLTVDPTGDAIRSQRHGVLKTKVAKFAETYNRLLRADLDRRGLRQCPDDEQWDQYWSALNSIVANSIPAQPSQSFVVNSFRDSGGPDFQFHIQNERDTSIVLYRVACAMALRFGIRGRVEFSVTTGDFHDPKLHKGFACLHGALPSNER